MSIKSEKQEIIRNSIIKTHEELRNQKKLSASYLVLAEDIKKSKLMKFTDQFASTVYSDIIAALDTSLFGSCKEGFVIDDLGICCGKYMKENSSTGKTIFKVFFDDLNSVEFDPKNHYYCILNYKDGRKVKVYNSIYAEYIARILNNICIALNTNQKNEGKVEEKTKDVQVTSNQTNESTYELKTKVNKYRGKYSYNDEVYKGLYSDINTLYTFLNIDYKINKNKDIETIKDLKEYYPDIFGDDTMNQAYQFMNEGYSDFVYLADDKYKEKDNLFVLEMLGNALIHRYEKDKNIDYLKLATVCFITCYERGKELSLDEFIYCAIQFAKLHEDDLDTLMDIVDTCHSIYSKMMKEDLYRKGEIHILICEQLSNYYLEFARAMRPDDTSKIEDMSLAIHDYSKAAFYKNKEAILELASIYNLKEYKDEEQAVHLMFKRDMLSLTSDIIDTPQGIDECFDDGCKGYKNGIYDDCYSNFEIACFEFDDSTNIDVFAASYYNLGILYLQSIEEYESYQSAVDEFYYASTHGLKKADFMLAVLYLNDIKECSYDDNKCYQTLSSVSFINYGIYSYYMAKCHREGIGTEVDLDKAKEYEQRYKEYYLKVLKESSY